MRLFAAPRRLYVGYAIVSGEFPIAVNLTLADNMQNLPRVTACFFGDSTVAEGEFHESLNLAATKRATEFALEKVEPYLIEFHTYRFSLYSMYDAELYPKKEMALKSRRELRKRHTAQ